MRTTRLARAFRYPSLETLIKLILLTMGVVLTLFVIGMRLHRDYEMRSREAQDEFDTVAARVAQMSFERDSDLLIMAADFLTFWHPTDDRESGIVRELRARDDRLLLLRLDGGEIWDLLLEENRLQLVFAFLTLIASVQVASLLAYSVTSPLRRLAWGFKQLTLNRSVRLPAYSVAADELALLTEAFNEMAEQLDKWRGLQSRIVRMDRLAALGEMVSGIAHEIRNPIASMRIHLDLLYDALAGDEKNRKRLRVFEEELARLERKLNLFLDFAKHRSNRREEIAPNTLLSWVESMMEKSAEAKGVSICVKPAETRAAGEMYFYGDPDEMRQAMLNLALNGVQAMGQGGVLTLSAFYGDGKIVFIVEDTGSGVSESIRNRIFEPFVTSRSDGTGLGLSITRKSIEDHGGILDYSTSERGSRFFMVMPLYVSKEAHDDDNVMDC